MRLTKATREAIKYACLHFHYAKCVPVNPLGYNVYNDKNEWCGVILYARGASKDAGKFLGLGGGEILELVRVALNGKQECTSQAVAKSLVLLKKDCPLCQVVVSYADCDQNHLGTIYQATNWIYIGETTKGEIHSYIVNGVKRHEKALKEMVIRAGYTSTLENMKKVLKTDNIIPCVTLGKRKYLMPLNKKMRKKILPLSKPYPKAGDWVRINYKEKYKKNKSEIEKK